MLKNKMLVGIVAFFIVQPIFSRSNKLADYEPGLYIGAQGGYAQTQEGSSPKDLADSLYSLLKEPKSIDIKDNKRFGGRVFIGYSFSPYFSMDAGFTFYPKNEFKVGYKELERYGFETNFYTLDLMGKGILPLEILSEKLAGWNVYAKLGAAAGIVYYELSFLGEKAVQELNVALKPCYALGLGYNFTDNFGIDLSWSGVYSNDKLGSSVRNEVKKVHMPSANLIALGISYKF